MTSRRTRIRCIANRRSSEFESALHRDSAASAISPISPSGARNSAALSVFTESDTGGNRIIGDSRYKKARTLSARRWVLAGPHSAPGDRAFLMVAYLQSRRNFRPRPLTGPSQFSRRVIFSPREKKTDRRPTCNRASPDWWRRPASSPEISPVRFGSPSRHAVWGIDFVSGQTSRGLRNRDDGMAPEARMRRP